MSEHPDGPALERVATDLDRTLFVVAGAGSGKTHTLVTRLHRLVTGGGIPLGSIAAITFTEKAAAELRERIRAVLRNTAGAAGTSAGESGNGPDRAAARVALDELDGAAIGTLHSFARRLLTEHPVAAGLPPRIDVLDEVASTVAFDERWDAFLDQALEDPELARPLLLLTSAGVKPDALKEIARSFNQNWDLVETRAPAEAFEIPAWEHELDGILAGIDGIAADRSHCRTPDDSLNVLIGEYVEWAGRIRDAGDESARLELLRAGEGARPSRSANGKGNQRNWDRDFDRSALRDRIEDIRRDCDELANDVAHRALTRLAVDLRRFTLEAAEDRRRDGQLEFHDLLVMARQLLRHPGHGPAVRRAVRDRYQRLLIDEFQDTDPIQVELAVLIASGDPHVGDKGWPDLEAEPGRLFFVGDPKQSIYRFRRADIELFLQAADRFGGEDRVTLSANHRSGAAIVSWINRTFGRLMVQPPYEASVALRPDPPVGPPVAVLGRTPHGDRPRADELRAREAEEVAATVRRALTEGWPVDRAAGGAGPDWQPARASDVAILVPTRLSLPFLEDSLTRAGVAYRTESASLVYASRLVRDLLLTLRAADDPSDELATVAALRSPLFGCGDDDLLSYRVTHRGRFDHSLGRTGDAPPGHPVEAGLAYLRELHQARHWSAPSDLLDRVVRERRVLELAAEGAHGRARDTWHRIRFVADQARAWSDATSGTLRQYLQWVRHQSSPGARVTEAVLPETDDDAVRIMTVHAAKGLQFPVTVVAGLSTQPQNRQAGGHVAWPPDGDCILSVGSRVRSPAFEAWKPIDEQMAHDERIRLLYVACTRARDHLVVSLHRATRARPVADRSRLTSAELLAETLGEDLDDLPSATGPTPVPDPARPARKPGGVGGDGVEPDRRPQPPPFAEWRSERSAALERSRRPRTLAATTLNQDGQPDLDADPGLQKRPRDLDLPPWRKGRYGTAVGRAVHGTLQAIDLATGEGLEGVVAAQAMAEGLTGPGDQRHVGDLVRAALAAPRVQEAAGRPHWKEVHVAVPLTDDAAQDGPHPGRPLLEGYVDLLYRQPSGRLVVVDYKTGPTSQDVDVDLLVESYRMQGASYALAVAEATGDEVAEVAFVFLTPDGPVERTLPSLATAVSDARNRIHGSVLDVLDGMANAPTT